MTAFVNSLLLLVAVGIILWESVHKFLSPGPVSGNDIIWVAGIGIVINTIDRFLFLSCRIKTLYKSSFWHMVADAWFLWELVVGG